MLSFKTYTKYKEVDWSLLVPESCELLAKVPQPPGVLVTQRLGLRGLGGAVRVVEAALRVQTLVHRAEDGGLSPGLGGLDEGVDEDEEAAEDAHPLLDVPPELRGDHPGVEGVHIDPGALVAGMNIFAIMNRSFDDSETYC